MTPRDRMLGALTSAFPLMGATATATTFVPKTMCEPDRGICIGEAVGLDGDGLSGVLGEVRLEPFNPALGTLDSVDVSFGPASRAGYFVSTNRFPFAPGPDGLYRCSDGSGMAQTHTFEAQDFSKLFGPKIATWSFSFATFPPPDATGFFGPVDPGLVATYRFTPPAVPEPTAASRRRSG